ncbi:MAG: tyrosine-type recombinase/integrase [Balneolaceae bacterium]
MRRKKNETKRERVYSIEEIKELWKAFDNQVEPVQSIYKTLLICGQRSGETRRMKWQDIDFVKQTWTIPKAKT